MSDAGPVTTSANDTTPVFAAPEPDAPPPPLPPPRTADPFATVLAPDPADVPVEAVAATTESALTPPSGSGAADWPAGINAANPALDVTSSGDGEPEPVEAGSHTHSGWTGDATQSVTADAGSMAAPEPDTGAQQGELTEPGEMLEAGAAAAPDETVDGHENAAGADAAGRDDGTVAEGFAEGAFAGVQSGAPPAAQDSPSEEVSGETTARQFLSYLVHTAASRTTAKDVASACRAIAGGDLDIEPLPLADAFGDNALALTVNGQTIIAMTIDAPLPSDVQLRGQPHTIAAARAGAAHTVLALIEPVDGQAEALDGATAMTTVLAAMASVLHADAAVFTASGLCAAPEALGAFATDLGHGQAPARLWFEVRLYEAGRDGDGRLRTAATSTGLAPFIGREIEFAAAAIDGRTLRRRILALAAHLSVNGFAMSGGAGDAAAAPSITAQLRDRGELLDGPALVLSLAGETDA